MGESMDGLRISPNYSAAYWNALSSSTPSDWMRAAEVVRDRLEGRFLRFADNCLKDPFSGFIVLAVDCLLAETIQQFRVGDIVGKANSEKHIKNFLAEQPFQPEFDEEARTRFYKDIRLDYFIRLRRRKCG